jgi:hypothetical protein
MMETTLPYLLLTSHKSQTQTGPLFFEAGVSKDVMLFRAAVLVIGVSGGGSRNFF